MAPAAGGPDPPHARVRALAATLGPADEVPGRAFDLLLDNACCGVVRYDELRNDGDDVLDTGWYDCRLGAALLAAVCRARGLPARVVVGYGLYPEHTGPHTWAEVWTGDAWTAWDLAAWDLSGGGGDRTWRDRFRGRVDRRFVVERLPRQFAGHGRLRLPRAFDLVVAVTPEGTRERLRDRVTGVTVHEEVASARPSDT